MESNEGDQSNQQKVPEWDKKLADKFFKHLRQEVREKPVDDEKVTLLDQLDTAHSNFIEQMLSYSFDDFMRFLGTDCVLRLQEKCQDQRFFSVLVREIQCGFATASLQCSAQQWTALAVIIEDLEDQDSQLAVNTLEKQLPQLKLTSSDLGERWLSWLRILCLRLLREDRVQVRRMAVEYFLDNLSVEQLCRLSLLPEFVVATNKSQLFDPEDENCLKEDQLEKFVANGNVELLLEALVAVSWENVPLLFWIRSFKAEQVMSVTKDLLFKLCLVVRAIDNYEFRKGVQEHVVLLFKTTLDGFSLRDYMMCMDSILNKGDSYIYLDQERLQRKISECTEFEEHMDCFNHRSLEKYTIHHRFRGQLAPMFLGNVMLKMETLSKTKHCFWRLVLFNTQRKALSNFYHKTYNVDTSLLQEGASLEKMQVHLLEKLECQTSEETSYLKARCVDLFTWNLRSWRQLEELNLDPLELMEHGTDEVISILEALLLRHEKRIKDETVLSALIARSNTNRVLRYAIRYLTKEEMKNCLSDLLVQKKLVNLPDGELSITMYLKLLLHGEPTRGLAHIEAFYAFNILNVDDRNAKIRYMAIWHLNANGSAETKSKIFKELLRTNEELVIEHPRYTENSEVHRQKMRIASALIDIDYSCDDHKCLETLLLPCDHLGISFMYEFLVGKCVKNIDWVMKALPTLEPRQQESYLSIAHIFIFNNLVKLNEDNKLSEMFSLLLPFTKVSCYETRTLAQLILHRLALECEVNSIHVPLGEILISSVETSLGKNLCELQSEPRLLLAEILLRFSKERNVSHYILFLTNVPCDERAICSSSYFILNKIKIARQAFRARKLVSSAQFAPSNNICDDYYFKKNCEFYHRKGLTVVVSQLDEITNFIRFILICQRFGVNFLVVGDESHLEDYDYGSLSIRRVNSGSLAGFLQTKRTEGYVIHACYTVSKLISMLMELQIPFLREGHILVMGL